MALDSEREHALVGILRLPQEGFRWANIISSMYSIGTLMERTTGEALPEEFAFWTQTDFEINNPQWNRLPLSLRVFLGHQTGREQTGPVSVLLQWFQRGLNLRVAKLEMGDRAFTVLAEWCENPDVGFAMEARDIRYRFDDLWEKDRMPELWRFHFARRVFGFIEAGVMDLPPTDRPKLFVSRHNPWG